MKTLFELLKIPFYWVAWFIMLPGIVVLIVWEAITGKTPTRDEDYRGPI